MDYCLTHNKKHKELEIINNNNNTIKNGDDTYLYMLSGLKIKLLKS